MKNQTTALALLTSGALLATTGCGLIDSSATNPVASEVLLVGLINPLKDTIDIDDQLAMSVFVADARQIPSLDRITEAPVTGALVSVLAGQASSELTEADAGLYYAISTGGEMVYAANQSYDIDVVSEGETYTATAIAPEPTGFEEDRSCVATGADLTLTLTGDSAERLLVAVYDSNGSETYSNLPQDSDELVDFLTADDAGTTFVIPGSAFADEDTAYGVVVAGISNIGTFSDNLNSLLSRYYVGAGRLGLVATYTDQTLCDELANTTD